MRTRTEWNQYERELARIGWEPKVLLPGPTGSPHWREAVALARVRAGATGQRYRVESDILASGERVYYCKEVIGATRS